VIRINTVRGFVKLCLGAWSHKFQIWANWFERFRGWIDCDGESTNYPAGPCSLWSKFSFNLYPFNGKTTNTFINLDLKFYHFDKNVFSDHLYCIDGFVTNNTHLWYIIPFKNSWFFFFCEKIPFLFNSLLVVSKIVTFVHRMADKRIKQVWANKFCY
jgi:hypothetical protein